MTTTKKKKRTRVRAKDKPWIENKVFSYGAKEPVVNLAIFNRELEIGHHYRNKMVELEQQRRQQREEALLSLPGGARLQPLEDEINSKLEELAELRAQKSARNSKSRDKKTRSPRLEREISVMRTSLKALRQERKVLRKALFMSQAWKDGEASRRETINERTREAYGAAGATAWGILVRINAEVALAEKHPTPPRFKRFDGSGKVVVQLQGGISTQNAVVHPPMALDAMDSRLRIVPVNGGIWAPGSRKRKTTNAKVRVDSDGFPMRKLGDAWVFLRVDTKTMQVESTSKRYRALRNRAAEEGKTFAKEMVSIQEPVWCKFPITMHRTLPKSAIIKWAWLRKVRTGPNFSWEFQVVLAEDTRGREPDASRATSGTVAIDVNWRLMPSDEACGVNTKNGVEHSTGCRLSALRVAFWRGDDGRTGELLLPRRWVCAYYKVHDIASIRDKLFNEHIEMLREWMRAHIVPKWLVDETTHIEKWRSPARLSVLLGKHWRARRFAGDETVYATLEAWRQRNKHLYCYERHLHDQLQRQRQDIYRKFAAELRRSYATVIFEDIDMRSLAEQKKPEESHLIKDAARKNRAAAAISILRNCVEQKVMTIKVDPAGTSYLCNNCGLPSFRGAADAVLSCSACGTTTDRDDNSCKNILDRGLQQIKLKTTSDQVVA